MCFVHLSYINFTHRSRYYRVLLRITTQALDHFPSLRSVNKSSYPGLSPNPAFLRAELSPRPPRSPRDGLKAPRARPEPFPNAAESGREIEFLADDAGFGPS